MSTRTKFEKVTADSPSRRDMPRQSDSKTQPPRVGGYPQSQNPNTLGPGANFNHTDKVTNTQGSDYHDVARPTSGLRGNFAEKDAQFERNIIQGQQGQDIKHFSGTNLINKMMTDNVGTTAYNNRPIDEVYRPATSHALPIADSISRPTQEKSETAMKLPDNTEITSKIKKGK